MMTKMRLIDVVVPQQNNGTDCGVFVCRYAYNMMLMQNYKFTQHTIANVVAESPSFKFGMKGIKRIRSELSVLIMNLSTVYLYTKTISNDDAESASSKDLVMLGNEREVGDH